MKYFFLVACLIFSLYASAQTDNNGPGRSIGFNSGGYIDVGDAYNDITFPFSLSVWVKLSPSQNDIAAIFASEEGSFEYRGFWLRVTKTNIGLGWGDGLGGNFAAYRRVKAAEVPDYSGKWVHIAAVVRADDNIDLYLNGVRLNSYWTGTSAYSMVNHTGDRVSIGKMYTNGETWWYNGEMDEMRLWNYSRTENEIRRDMCRKLSGDEAGLIGYWNMNETSGNQAMDNSSGGHHGTRINLDNYNYSGAPIGDESIYSYTAQATIDLDNVSVTHPGGDIEGVHIYKVNNYGTVGDCEIDSYYGIYTFTNDSFESNVTVNLDADSILYREDNSFRTWNGQYIENNAIDFTYRRELIPFESLAVDLGPDLSLCTGESALITYANDENYNLSWSDQSKGNTYQTDGEEIVWLEVSSGCLSARDTVRINYQESPSLDFGVNEVNCQDLPFRIQLTPGNNELTWSDGQTGSDRTFYTPGTYWATLENACGSDTDTLQIVAPQEIGQELPNVITPNEDGFNERFEVEETLFGSEFKVFNRWGKLVYFNENYQNEWTGAYLTSGVYYYTLQHACQSEPIKGWVQILY